MVGGEGGEAVGAACRECFSWASASDNPREEGGRALVLY